MNKEKLLKEFNDKVEELRQELLTKLEQEDKEEKKPFEVELPNIYDCVYYFNEDGSKVYMTGFNDSEHCKNMFLNGLFFETKEEAEQHLKEQRLLFKIKKWAKIKNDGWEPDWEDDEDKYYIYHNCDDKELRVSYATLSDNFTRLPYFKSREIAQACIEEFGEEIKEVLC